MTSAETLRMCRIEARREEAFLAAAEAEVTRRHELEREAQEEAARHEWRRRELARRQAEIAAQAKKPILLRKAATR